MTLQECIDLFHERERTRPPGTPIRVYRSATLRTTYWRQDATQIGKANSRLSRLRAFDLVTPEWRRCDELAATGEHLGLARVGSIIETSQEDTPCQP